ncbi:hypothetical protein LSUE1_G009730 [Lachnellula suecica]|uniref:Uncharacterized protein n=1 Tax=Lachnellula suecica TaxID=602035 RepID=A0A8T9BU78_9HELO|nr:hypothetical protein LSUE1_G009730 [Lachnellula suecica]
MYLPKDFPTGVTSLITRSMTGVTSRIASTTSPDPSATSHSAAAHKLFAFANQTANATTYYVPPSNSTTPDTAAKKQHGPKFDAVDIFFFVVIGGIGAFMLISFLGWCCGGCKAPEPRSSSPDSPANSSRSPPVSRTTTRTSTARPTMSQVRPTLSERDRRPYARTGNATFPANSQDQDDGIAERERRPYASTRNANASSHNQTESPVANAYASNQQPPAYEPQRRYSQASPSRAGTPPPTYQSQAREDERGDVPVHVTVPAPVYERHWNPWTHPGQSVLFYEPTTPNPHLPPLDWWMMSRAVQALLVKLVEEGKKEVIMDMHFYGGCLGSDAVRGYFGRKARSQRDLSGGVLELLYMCAFVNPVGASLLDAVGGTLQPFIRDVHGNGNIMVDLNMVDIFYHDLSQKDKVLWNAELRPVPLISQTTPNTCSAYQHFPATYL